jgi:hypothetical protein
MSFDYTIIFNDLFAFRMQYQDYIREEYIIINKLKNKLIDLGIEENNINDVLFNFYNYFDIPITMNQIEMVHLHSPYSLYYEQTNENNDIDSEGSDYFNDIDEGPQYFTTILYTNNTGGPINNLLNMLFNINNQQDNYEDVVVTTDTDSLNKIPICKITNDMQLICSICQEEMNTDDEYINIECKHIFHRSCLTTYLENYNHICPTCRKEIGKPNAHI